MIDPNQLKTEIERLLMFSTRDEQIEILKDVLINTYRELYEVKQRVDELERCKRQSIEGIENIKQRITDLERFVF